ncbi:MAG: DUF692 domain-containing protein [Hyphomicrobiales bacterium]|nr:DUF692 domain-containing protein [Hyphomicrobiales bacterium]MBV8824918.1 DUF692 domain-containing protein [Hyphomicrobiales bacterium]MBV9429593.1 DUF692 domain-containing protein [Bradyrhizobiaceae bacterium]
MSLAFASTARVPEKISARAGIGLRFPHHQAVIAERPQVAWFEVHGENYMGGGAPLRELEAIRRDYPVSLHGVGLSLGSADGLDAAHLERFAALAARIEPGLVSEHLTWSISDGEYLGDLLPLPLTKEALDVVCENVDRFQQTLQRQILVENPSSYLEYRHSTMVESEFLVAIARRTGCGILCDLGNIFVSAANHDRDAETYLAALPPGVVKEFHLAGHTVRPLSDGTALRIDDHGSPVDPAVWALFGKAVARFGAVPTLIERDSNIPPLDALIAEADCASAILLQAEESSADADAA